MAITDLPTLLLPAPAPATDGANIIIDASGEKVACVFRAPRTGTLDLFEFRLQAAASAPASGLRLSFQSLDLATGYPDGTQDQFRVVTAGLAANAWVTPPGALTDDGTDSGVKRLVTAGDLMACVVEFEAWAAGNSVVPNGIGSDRFPAGFPYTCWYTSAWSRNGSFGCVLKYDDGSYAAVPGTFPFKAITQLNYSNASTPDEAGVRFAPAIGCRVRGVIWALVAHVGDCEITLYDADDVVLASTTSDKDAGTGSAAAYMFGPVELAPGQVYRITAKPTSANLVGFLRLQAEDNARLAAWAGENYYWTERTDGGAWTDRDAYCTPLSLMIDGIEAGGGGPMIAVG